MASKDKKLDVEIDGEKVNVTESEPLTEPSSGDVIKKFEDLPEEVKGDIAEKLEPSAILAINTSSTTHTLEDGAVFAPRARMEISQKDFDRLSPHGIRAVE